jgi:hypothetical protein
MYGRFGLQSICGSQRTFNQHPVAPQRRCQNWINQVPSYPQLAQNRDELRGDLLIRGFWERGTDCIMMYVSRIPMPEQSLEGPRQGPGS